MFRSLAKCALMGVSVVSYLCMFTAMWFGAMYPDLGEVVPGTVIIAMVVAVTTMFKSWEMDEPIYN